MSFDWKSFAKGFFERTSEIQQERAEEAKTFEEEQRAAAQRNAQTISRRRAVADQVTGYANYLRSNGATDEQIQAAIASGPQAIQEFTTAVQAQVERNGGRPLGAEDVATLIRMPQGFTGVDMSLQEFIEQTYGISATAAPERADQEFGILDRISGRDQMARAEERLNRTPYVEGMTIQQINEAAARGDYQSLIPGTFITFAGDTSFGQAESDDFMASFNDRIRFLESNDTYNGLPTRLGQEAGRVAQQEMRQRQMEPLIMQAAARDPEGFMDLHETQLRLSLGDDYVDSLKEDLGLIDPDTGLDGDDNGGDEGGDEAGTDTATELPQEEQLPAGAGEIEVSTLSPLPTETPADTESGQEDGGTDGAATEGGDTEQADEGGPFTITGEDGVEYTYEDWQGMSRSQRQAAGLPTSRIGAEVQFRRFFEGLGMPSFDQSEGSRWRNEGRTPRPVDESETNATGSSGRRSRREASTTERALLEQGVDPQSMQVLNSYGEDIRNAVIARNASTPLEIMEAVEEYAAENGIPLPEDLSVIVYALQSNMTQQ